LIMTLANLTKEETGGSMALGHIERKKGDEEAAQGLCQIKRYQEDKLKEGVGRDYSLIRKKILERALQKTRPRYGKAQTRKKCFGDRQKERIDASLNCEKGHSLLNVSSGGGGPFAPKSIGKKGEGC